MVLNNNWSIYFSNNLVQSNPESEAAIVSLWTPVKNITDKIDPNLFCLAGQLYSKDGINYILRNILANPKIRYIIVCGAELQKAEIAIKKGLKYTQDKAVNVGIV